MGLCSYLWMVHPKEEKKEEEKEEKEEEKGEEEVSKWIPVFLKKPGQQSITLTAATSVCTAPAFH